MLEKLDYNISKFIYDLFKSNNLMKQIPYYFGLLPYEIYVIPGMYLSIFLVTLLGNPGPIQFHLLPHWFAYSIFQFLKHKIKKDRPGCKYKNMKEFIDRGHCIHGHEKQSFPSGHTGVSSALASALFMEMNYSDNPKFFEISIRSKLMKGIISYLAIFIAFMIGIHRVSKGYHSFFDVIIGCLLGISVGSISWFTLEYYKKKYYNVCKRNKKDEDCDNYKEFEKDEELNYWLKDWSIFNNKLIENKSLNYILGFSRLMICGFVGFLFLKFLKNDIWKLATIKH